MITLERPICFFDLETTGLEKKDRIVSIAVVKLNPDLTRESRYAIVNPTIPIPKEATDVHGITDEMVKDKPLFSQIAKSIYAFFKDCDIAGYNNNFYDNAILQEEMFRCGINFPETKINSIDSCFIFKKYEKRDLATALKFYCNKELSGAHNSLTDAEATVDVFLGQIKMYPELSEKTVTQISEMCKTDNRVDWNGRLILDSQGDICYNFGKARGKKVKDDKGFGRWVLDNDFPETLKAILRPLVA